MEKFPHNIIANGQSHAGDMDFEIVERFGLSEFAIFYLANVFVFRTSEYT